MKWGSFSLGWRQYQLYLTHFFNANPTIPHPFPSSLSHNSFFPIFFLVYFPPSDLSLSIIISLGLCFLCIGTILIPTPPSPLLNSLPTTYGFLHTKITANHPHFQPTNAAIFGFHFILFIIFHVPIYAITPL